jgi:hypothetical protein
MAVVVPAMSGFVTVSVLSVLAAPVVSLSISICIEEASFEKWKFF